MGRNLADWLEGYLDYTKHSEPPKSYHLWTGISTVAAALQRKVYIRWNMGRLHPNLFTVLVGPSGRCRKGTALGFGQDLIRQVPSIRLIAQRTTPEQLIRDMKESIAEYIDPTTGAVELHCSMTVMSGELAVFLGHQNVDFLAILTNLYDSEDEWEYRTKHQGQEKIKGVCLNFLGGTAPDWIKSMIPEAALGGGFTSRIIWVVEWDKGQIVPDPTPTPRMYELRELLIGDLERIHTMNGEMKREDQALEFYEHWYVEQTKVPPFAFDKFDGYCARRATHVQKLAMIMSAARSDEMVVRIEDLQRAIRILEDVEKTLPEAFQGLGKAMYADVGESVLNYLLKHKREVKHSEILRKFFPDINNYSLTVAMETLIQMEAVEVTALLPRGDKKYALNPNYTPRR
jgi:hypothetical protein